LDADGVGEQSTAQQAQKPARLPEHVEAGERPAPEVLRTRDWMILVKVTLPLEVDRPYNTSAQAARGTLVATARTRSTTPRTA